MLHSNGNYGNQNNNSNLSNNNLSNNNLGNNNLGNNNVNNSSHGDNDDNLSVSNWVDQLSLSDISVGEILDIYKNDTDLLKHILAAKTEEDKRKGAEEIRRAEEARLHSKFIDLQLNQNRRSSILDDSSLCYTSNDWLSVNNDLLFLNNTPPSPSQLQPLSPYTLFEVPFADLNLSAPSSPEPQVLPLLIEKINNKQPTPPPPNPPISQVVNKERVSCKRTLSRTRSTRKPSVKALSKKNRSSQYQQSKSEQEQQEQIEQQVKELPLDHDKVMEALRAKLQRSTQQQKELKNNPIDEITSIMSPTGILLLDLKNPKKSFPVRPKATPRASVVKKPNSFISAHNKLKDSPMTP